MGDNKPTEPFAIFTEAENFLLSSQLLNQVHERAMDMRLISPLIVMAAFAFELYLKCAYAVATGKQPPFGHELKKLFQLLPLQMQTKIYDHFRAAYPWADLIKQASGDAPSFDYALDRYNRIFVDSRYLYERSAGLYVPANDKWKGGIYFLLAESIAAVRNAIVEHEPGWPQRIVENMGPLTARDLQAMNPPPK